MSEEIKHSVKVSAAQGRYGYRVYLTCSLAAEDGTEPIAIFTRILDANEYAMFIAQKRGIEAEVITAAGSGGDIQEEPNV